MHAFHFDILYNALQDVKKAIHFYTKAQCYSPAILLAKEHGLDNELMHLALLSSPTDMLDAARLIYNLTATYTIILFQVTIEF